MKKIRFVLRQLGFLLLVLLPPSFLTSIAAQADSSFTHQGRLSTNGVLANGDFEFSFALYDAVANGGQIGSTLTNAPVTVSEGLFSTSLDFGVSPFDGTARWLEIAVRPAGTAESFTTLAPRQQLTAVPYSLFALNAVTPTQLIAASNSLQTSIMLGLDAQFSSGLALYQTLSNRLNNALPTTNPSASGMRLNQNTKADPFPLTIYADGLAGTNNGYVLGNSYVTGGSGGPYPVAFMRPTLKGYSMPFDLMPNGTNADVWMDLCSDDLWGDSTQGTAGAVEFLDIRKRGIANGGFAEITTRAWGEGKVVRPLWLQGDGGPLLIGGYVDPLPYVSINTEQASIMAAQVTINATKNYWSFDAYVNSRFFAQLRPSTNVNLVFDGLDGAVLIAAGNDSASSGIPIVHQAISHLFSTDSRSTYGLVFSNNVLAATAVVVSQSLGIGAPGGPHQIFTVTGTNGTSQPWPVVNGLQRNALAVTLPSAGSAILNSETGQPELADGQGHWYRFGQRPALASTADAITVITDGMDVLLVKGTGPRSVILPAAGLYTNRIIEIKDASFVAGTDNITISSADGRVENGIALAINTNGGAVRLVSDGNEWFKLN